MHRVARISSSRVAARALRTTAAQYATPIASPEPHNHLEPIYAAIDDRLNVVRKKWVLFICFYSSHLHCSITTMSLTRV